MSTPSPRASGRVLVINTGGTLTMVESPHGLIPAGDFASRIARTLPTAPQPAMPAFELHEWTPLLDSSNAGPAEWLRLAREIRDAREDYDAVVILHGTDTLAYTASALSFLLAGHPLPIILTGSQIPLSTPGSDAPGNWQLAMQAATLSRFREVSIAFGSHVWRGNRARKLDAAGNQAFNTPRWPPLASLESGALRAHPEFWLASDTPRQGASTRASAYTLPAELSTDGLHMLACQPGNCGIALEQICERMPRLVLVQLFGSGNGPSEDRRFMDALRWLQNRDIPVLGLSPCPFGYIGPTPYAAGLALQQAGLLLLAGMTPEAAWTKAIVLLAHGLRNQALRRTMCEDLAGEIADTGPSIPG